MQTFAGRALTLVVMLLAGEHPLLAQDKPPVIIEAAVGWSGFIDEVWDHFPTVGGGARFFVTPRVAIGPEVTYLTGAGDSLDASHLTVTGNLTFDFVRETAGRRVVPYLAVGGGFIRQRTLVGSGPGSTTLQPYTTSEGTVSGGAGVRFALGPRAFIAPEFRLGWEPESRVTVMIGIRPR